MNKTTLSGIFQFAIAAMLLCSSVLLTLSVTVNYSIPPPVGYWTLNGQTVSSGQIINVTSPTLDFTFVATQYGYNVLPWKEGGVQLMLYPHGSTSTIAWQSVSVGSSGDYSIYLANTTSENTWTGWGVLPAPGSYDIVGEVMYGTPPSNIHFADGLSIIGSITATNLGNFTWAPLPPSLRPPAWLGFVPSIFAWVGMALIVSGSLFIVIPKIRKH